MHSYYASRKILIANRAELSILHHFCKGLLLGKPSDALHQISVAVLVICDHPANRIDPLSGFITTCDKAIKLTFTSQKRRPLVFKGRRIALPLSCRILRAQSWLQAPPFAFATSFGVWRLTCPAWV